MPSETPDIVRDEVWRRRGLAKTNAHYYAALSDRFSSLDRLAKVVLALSASTSAASFFVLARLEAFGRWLTVFNAVVAIFATVFLDSRRMTKLPAIAAHHSQRALDWEDLWLRIETGDIVTVEEVAKAKRADESLLTDEHQFSLWRRLAKKSQARAEDSDRWAGDEPEPASVLATRP